MVRKGGWKGGRHTGVKWNGQAGGTKDIVSRRVDVLGRRGKEEGGTGRGSKGDEKGSVLQNKIGK